MNPYFNPTALKKDITRYAPLWGSWLGVLLYFYLRRRSDFYYGMTYPLFVYAGICAVTLFGDLYNLRRCYALHAMPPRREGWFAVHALAGFLFFLVPTGVFFLATGLIGGVNQVWLRSAGALGAYSLEYLCFYGIALLCVMLAGNRIGALLIYCAVNFLAPVAGWLLRDLYQPFLIGIPVEIGFLDYLCPVLRMAQFVPGYYPVFSCTPPFSNAFIWNGEWGYHLICSGLGLLAALCGMVLYRFRRLEQAGDFAVCPAVRYVSTAAFSLIAGALMFQQLGHTYEHYYWLFLYIPIFYFAAAMLVEKRFHVLRAGHLLTLGILAAVLFNSLWIIRYDAFSINSYVPKPENVRRVQVYIDRAKYSKIVRYNGDNENWQTGLTVTAQQDISRITDTHRILLAEDREDKEAMLYLTYTLKSGIRVRRYYPMENIPYSEQWEALDMALATRKTLFGETDWDSFMQRVYYIHVSNSNVHQQLYFAAPSEISDALPMDVKIHREDLLKEFLLALDEDCAEGELSQIYTAKYTVCIKSKSFWGKEKTVEITIPGTAYNTLNCIERCWKLGYSSPDRTITEDTALPDSH